MTTATAARFTVTLSPALHATLSRIEAEDGCDRETVLRKALLLYVTARAADREGLAVGMAENEAVLRTHVVGL